MNQTLKNFRIEELPEFDNHQLVNFIYDESTGLKGFITIHRGDKAHPSFGATRLWNYDSELEALKDALQLSKTMSYKAALAGLPYGGGKAVLLEVAGKRRQRKEMLKAYAERVNFLAGHFITGADVGLSRKDVQLLRRRSPYFVGLKNDPVELTALGVFFAIEVCLEELFGSERIRDHRFAIQGLGKVGLELLKLLYQKGGQVLVADIDPRPLAEAKRTFPEVKVIKPGEIHQQPVDVFSPCALSSSITSENISELRCRAIVGGANNQLESPEVGEALSKLDILYAPDYVVNAGGLIGVVDEFENSTIGRRRVKKRIGLIKETLRRILEKSKKEKKATNLVADEMAEGILRGLT
jgi:leucine dehydrogenase